MTKNHTSDEASEVLQSAVDNVRSAGASAADAARRASATAAEAVSGAAANLEHAAEAGGQAAAARGPR
jgi:hypothetical protein